MSREVQHGLSAATLAAPVAPARPLAAPAPLRSAPAFSLILLYLALVYIRPQEYSEDLQGVPVLPVVLGASVVLWLLQRDKRLEAPQHWLLPLLIAAMAASVAVKGWFGGAAKAVTDHLPLIVLFYVLGSSADSREKHGVAVRLIALCTLVLAVHGIDQSLSSGVGWSGAQTVGGGRIRYVGVFNDPNDLALAFVIALPMLGYALTRARNVLSRLFWLAALGATTYGIYLTNSRGGMLAAMAQFLAYVVVRFGILRAALLAPVGLAGLWLLPSRLEATDAVDASAAGRVESWYEGLQMLMRHPVIGVGKGFFTENNPLTAHNSLVLVFAELGLVGYFLWLGFVGLSFYMAWRLARTPHEAVAKAAPCDAAGWDQLRRLARTYLYAMLGFAVATFFLSRSYNVLLFMLCALCVGLYLTARRQCPGFAPVRFRRAMGPLVAFELASIAFIYALVKVLL